jgi:hypothetical protein
VEARQAAVRQDSFHNSPSRACFAETRAGNTRGFFCDAPGQTGQRGTPSGPSRVAAG